MYYTVNGFIWLVGNTKPIFVEKGGFETYANAEGYIDDLNMIFKNYQDGVPTEKTITICNTLFRLESITAMNLSIKA